MNTHAHTRAPAPAASSAGVEIRRRHPDLRHPCRQRTDRPGRARPRRPRHARGRATSRRRLSTPSHDPPGRVVIRILIAEDQAMIRGALASLLSLEDDIEVVAELERGDLVLAAARASRPDVALLDIEMPGLDGITVAGELARELPETRTLILTTFARPGYLRRALDNGASGFLLKDAPARELAAGIREVAAGRRAPRPRARRRSNHPGNQPPHGPRTRRPRRLRRPRHRRRDRTTPPPLRGHRPQLPQLRDPQAARPQPRRSPRPRRTERLALEKGRRCEHQPDHARAHADSTSSIGHESDAHTRQDAAGCEHADSAKVYGEARPDLVVDAPAPGVGWP